MIRRTPLVLGLLLAVAAGIPAACAATGATSGSPVATTSVDLPPSYRFAPADITVATGATVTWTNDDHFTHSVQFLDGGLPAEPLTMQPGASVTFTFDRAGTFHYQCHLHPRDMTGSVTVAP
jgi:plastocyanin